MMEDLDKLIEAVEGGSATVDDLLESGIPFEFEYSTWAAYLGSLDAAKALHETLLPGWDYAIMTLRRQNCVQAIVSPKGQQDGYEWFKSECPARAWLIAILKAYRSI